MARVVESVSQEFGQALKVDKIVTGGLAGATRFNEISRRLGRPAPVPSIFIQGELVFDVTPGEEELKNYLQKVISSARE